VSQLLDNIRGALLGGLCGDEIGRPTECLDYQTIRARFGRIAGPQVRSGKPAGTEFTTRFPRDWGLTSAAAVMMIAPILVIFLALQ
jgi:hypothetical protein